MIDAAKPVLRILGIDPGLRITGFGLIEKTGNRLAYLASGCIRTRRQGFAARPSGNDLRRPARTGGAAPTGPGGGRDRLCQRQSTIDAAARPGAWRGDHGAGRQRPRRCRVHGLQVKQAVVGNGHADKVQVQHMVRRLLSLSADPSPDAADALACAIAHAHGGQGFGQLAEQRPARTQRPPDCRKRPGHGRTSDDQPTDWNPAGKKPATGGGRRARRRLTSSTCR
jgi:crossover junction endodeoxyribonuclease RuvC